MGLLVNSIVRKRRPPFYSFLFILMSFAGVSLVVTKGNVAAVLRETPLYSRDARLGDPLCKNSAPGARDTDTAHGSARQREQKHQTARRQFKGCHSGGRFRPIQS